MGPVAISLGLAALGTLGFAMATNRPALHHPDAVRAGFAMVGVWALSMVLNAFLTPPDSKALNPVIDLALIAWVAWTLWRGKRFREELWKIGLIGMLVFQCLLHVVYTTEYQLPGVLYRYTLALNLSFLAELACIAWPGVGYVAGRARGWLRVRRGAGPSVGAQ